MKPTGIFLGTSLLVLANLAAAQSVSPKARAIHDGALIVDTHADTPQRFLDEGFDIGNSDPKDIGHISLDKARAGNLGAEFFSIWVEPKTNQGHFAQHTLDLIDSVYEQAARHPDRMTMAFSVADIERTHKEKKLAALLGIEGGHSIENDVRVLRDFYRLGVRYMTLSWSNTNEWADSSGDIDDASVQHHNGLTDFGKQVVREMNRQGMLVDISHVSDKTFYDALEVSRVPLIASHSSVRAISNHPRNMSDGMIKVLAAKGGVVQINYERNYLSEEYRTAFAAVAGDVSRMEEKFKKECGDDNVCIGKAEIRLEKELTEAGKLPHVSWEKIIEHIDHVVRLVGPDHVGLGSDFDGADMPDGLEDCSKLPKITEALLRKGYSEEDIRKILGGNILRVMEQSEKISKEMQAAQ